jgi:hypothetical protein
MRTRTVALLTVLLVVSVSGCGDEQPTTTDPTTDRTAGPTTQPTTTESTTTEPLGEPTAGTTTPPSEGLQKVRVVGEVVEVGDCVVVRDDNAITWTITGKLAPDLVSGDRVAVTGAPDLAALGCGGPVVVAATVRLLG